jgi:hypothetical protein
LYKFGNVLSRFFHHLRMSHVSISSGSAVISKYLSSSRLICDVEETQVRL